MRVKQATKLIEQNGIDVLVGVTFRSHAGRHDPVVRSRTLFIGTNSGPAPIAGRNCSRYFFSTASQDDQVHETMGRYASLKGYQQVVTIAPDYEAARDAIAAFRRHFKGQISRELFPKLGQTEFSNEFNQIAEIEPDAIFAFMPGGMGVELVKQFQTSGLKGIVPFLSSRTVNAVTLPYSKETGEGLFSAAHWAPNLDNPANKRFVREFSRAYEYAPSVYAAQGYDAAKLIHFALELTGGVKDQEALLSAIHAAPFESVRGDSGSIQTSSRSRISISSKGSDAPANSMKWKQLPGCSTMSVMPLPALAACDGCFSKVRNSFLKRSVH